MMSEVEELRLKVVMLEKNREILEKQKENDVKKMKKIEKQMKE
jgi:hypothetical protein